MLLAPGFLDHPVKLHPIIVMEALLAVEPLDPPGAQKSFSLPL